MSLAAFIIAMGAYRPGLAGELEVTPEQEKICAKAERRYKKLFPDAPDAKDDGAVVVTRCRIPGCWSLPSRC